MKKKKDLVDQAFGFRRGGGWCWRTRLSGDVLEFVEAVEDRMERNGERVIFRQLSRILKAEFDILVEPTTIGRHYRGRCTCR